MIVDLGVEIVPFGGGEGAEHEAEVNEVELLVPGPWLTVFLLASSSMRLPQYGLTLCRPSRGSSWMGPILEVVGEGLRQ